MHIPLHYPGDPHAWEALSQPLGRFTADAWDKVFSVDLRGPVFLVQEALPWLEKSPHASVVNVISAGAFLFSTFNSMYAAAKAGLMSFTRAMGAEFVVIDGAARSAEMTIDGAEIGGRGDVRQREPAQRARVGAAA